MECACVVRQETSILKMLSEPFVNGADDVITESVLRLSMGGYLEFFGRNLKP